MAQSNFSSLYITVCCSIILLLTTDMQLHSHTHDFYMILSLSLWLRNNLGDGRNLSSLTESNCSQ